MPKRVYYHPGTGGDAICLDGDGAYIGSGGDLRSHKWNRDISLRSLIGVSLGLREVDVDCVVLDDKANELRRAADADMTAKSPGMLVVDDTWKMRCYIVASDTRNVYADAVGLRLTLALMDRQWWREKSLHFVMGMGAGGLDHDYDHEYDLSFSSGSGKVTVESLQGALPKITFYGPCTSPYVIIGDNRYEVDVQVLSGHTCVIDATVPRPTVELVDSYGNRQSVFSSAVRTGGRDSGTYAFQPLEHGVNVVQWSGSFAFDVVWHEMDTEPPW